MRCRPTLLLAVLLLGVSSCAMLGGSDEDAGWVAYRLDGGPPRRDLVRACQWAMVRADFPPGEDDAVTGTITSGWDVQLAPYSGKGRRARALVEIQEGDRPRSYQLRVRVEQQRNVEVHKPLDPAAAEWEEYGYDEERARVVLYHVLTQVEEPARARGAQERR